MLGLKLVVKYGGTTLSSAADIQRTAKYLETLSADHELAVVCSAVGETTDQLVSISKAVSVGDRSKAAELVRDVTERHHTIAMDLVDDHRTLERLLGSLNTVFADLRALIDGLLLLGEETPRSLDYLLSFGERLSIIMVAAALENNGAKAVHLTGKDAGILTDAQFGRSRPLMDTTKLRVSKAVGDIMAGGTIPVLGGYSGADQHGRVTTFGRGGSDYTATIIAACIDADQVWLMGDMDGMMTADPRIVDDARVLQEVSYAEVVEMTMFGARQIHPRTFEPVLDRGIPLRIRSATNTDHPGTLVVPTHSDSARNTIKCVSTMRGNGLIDIQGFGMVGSPGTAAGIFGTLAGPGISVVMISQNPSESSITIVLKNADLHKAVHILEMEGLGKTIKRLDITTDVAVVALIGAGLRGTVGTASRVFTAVRNKDVNVIMITQGSSELNLAFVVKDSDAETVVRALHAEFGLANLD